MARASSRYVCQACGAVAARWAGRCDACGTWNSFVEETLPASAPVGGGSGRKRRRTAAGIVLESLKGAGALPPRLPCGIAEFDRVTGGGLVPGSTLLLGGEPGVGKSTLLLQVAAALAERKQRVLYVSGEEAIDQVRLRGRRMGLAEASVELAAATEVEPILTTLAEGPLPSLVIVDSIQTLWIQSLESAPGTVSQVRASAQALTRSAKERGFALVLVGHVNKEGAIAGPKVLEHMVDAVLNVEGERGHTFRILRADKNRFGATDEIGVFEMSETGMMEVENPSALFLSDRDEAVSGSAVFAGIEGTRPVLVEVQALVAGQPAGSPRRAVVGWDSGRLAMLLAVLETRCGLQLSVKDVYLNVVGGLRVAEPAADLAVAAALVSAISDKPVPAGCILFGEVGLGGEIRPVSRPELRLREAAKLGFAQALGPGPRGQTAKNARLPEALTVYKLTHLRDLVARLASECGGAKTLAGKGWIGRRRDESSAGSADAKLGRVPAEPSDSNDRDR
ncbi:MAG: DNA repair protein RadA [Rhodospirillales bacterium]|nr:DNA repair protein RadA [Rhodospirillales bacterium]